MLINGMFVHGYIADNLLKNTYQYPKVWQAPSQTALYIDVWINIVLYVKLLIVQSHIHMEVNGILLLLCNLPISKTTTLNIDCNFKNLGTITTGMAVMDMNARSS